MALFDIVEKHFINQGWSDDKKYCVTDRDGRKYLLRISSISKYQRKKTTYAMMKCVAELGIPMCRPLEFGTCEEGVYILQTWIDGVDAECVIKTHSAAKQYQYGLEAGRILKRIHSIPAPEEQEDWEIRFQRKMDRKIQSYHNCPVKYDHGEIFIDYI